MSSSSKKLIAVIGATGQQGGAVVRALQAQGQFKVRALTRYPAKHRGLADEVVEADLDRPGNPQSRICRSPWRFPGHQFLGTRHRRAQAGDGGGTRVPRKRACNTLSGRRCPTSKRSAAASCTFPTSPARRRVDRIVKEAGFAHHTFVIAPFFYQNVMGATGSAKTGRRNLRLGASDRSHCARHSHGRYPRARRHRSWRVCPPGSGRQWAIPAAGR